MSAAADEQGAASRDELRRSLRLGAPVDEARLAAEAGELERLDAAPAPRRWAHFLRRGGPGYLQSAMTLGGGTASSAVFAGRLFGYELLWVAPLGMLLGVVMFAALSHQTLSTGARPFEAMRRYAGAPLAYAWAIGSLAASIIWHFPQYGLAGAALADLGAVGGVSVSPALAVIPLFVVAVAMSLLYGRSDRAVRLYERCVKLLVFGIVLAFGAVVAVSARDIDWGAVARGFVPRIPEARGGTSGVTLVVSGLAAAVGINMVFLYPYTLLARGWGRAHRRLARFDLVLGMFVPYTLATSLVVIATAHAIPWDAASGAATKLAPVEAARALGGVLGDVAGRVVFDLGLVGMALSTITLHMVCTGFVVMELTGKPFGSRAWRIGTLLPAVGVLGPVVWKDLLWLAVPTNIVCGLFLPLAYIGIIRLQRSEAYLGADAPRGSRGALWLCAMVAVTAFLLFAFGSYVVQELAK